MQRVWRTVTGFYHVCARGTGKQLIFEGDEDRWEFLELMRECCREAVSYTHLTLPTKRIV